MKTTKTTTTKATEVATIPAIDHGEAMRLQADELDRDLALLRSLSDEQWSAPTECDGWDVRMMWLHVLGACEAGASTVENARQLAAAYRRRRADGTPLEAGLSSTQIESRRDLSPAELVERLSHVAPRTIRGRRRLPKPVRSLKLAIDAPVVEKWSLGYLTDIIYLRDLWMHRVDTARATGSELDLTPAHDGRIIADIVAEWARRHGEGFVLELAGPAGGTYVAAGDGPSIELDAVEFTRALSGRAPAGGLLDTVVPF
jgi:uncharacterized protein (TIGR03083 family)